MSCAVNGCPRELTSVSPEVSPGIVADDELIVRAAYTPMHVKNGRVKTSITEAGKLIGDGISVWRAGAGKQAPETLRDKMPAREGQSFEGVYGALAADIRRARAPSYEGRLFCVIDDCATDGNGGTDPFHAGIRLCNDLHAEGITKETPLFLEVQEQLRLLLSRKIC